MAEAKARDVPIFEVGDTIRIELRVSDEDGISRLETRFRNDSEGSAKSVYRSVELGGETDARAVIAFEDLPPGDYVCEYIALTDRKGNQSLIVAPGIEFRVEGAADEHQGPALLDWSFA